MYSKFHNHSYKQSMVNVCVLLYWLIYLFSVSFLLSCIIRVDPGNEVTHKVGALWYPFISKVLSQPDLGIYSLYLIPGNSGLYQLDTLKHCDTTFRYWKTRRLYYQESAYIFACFRNITKAKRLRKNWEGKKSLLSYSGISIYWLRMYKHDPITEMWGLINNGR